MQERIKAWFSQLLRAKDPMQKHAIFTTMITTDITGVAILLGMIYTIDSPETPVYVMLAGFAAIWLTVTIGIKNYYRIMKIREQLGLPAAQSATTVYILFMFSTLCFSAFFQKVFLLLDGKVVVLLSLFGIVVLAVLTFLTKVIVEES